MTAFPPPAARRQSSTTAVRVLVAVALVAIVGVYALAALVTKDEWSGRATERTRIALTPQTPTGSPPSSDGLDRARDVLAARVSERGVAGAQVAVEGATIVVTVPPADAEGLRDVGAVGQLYVRPVIHAIPAEAPKTPNYRKTTDDAGRAQAVADEKALRQSTDPQIQLLALQFQAGRCNDPDALAGRDDPELPLITCSTDRTTVYLLDTSVISGVQVTGATAERDQRSDQHVVDLGFDEDAARIWETFTAAHVGTQTAFTLDTAVVSAPEIREAIPGGRTQITGNFTAEGARDLAASLGSGALPFALTAETANTTVAERQPGFPAARVGLLVGGALVAILVIGGVVGLTMLGRGAKRPPAGVTPQR